LIPRITTALLFLICIVSLIGYGPAYCEQAPAFINVKECGATGDGVTDDTEAILKAIKLGSEKLLSVYFPKGSYKLTKTLTIEQQSLMGTEPGAWPADSGPMPQFLIHHNSGPALVMRDGASVHGINFNYEPRKFDKYPPAILMEGQGLSITNVRLQTCDDGIITGPKSAVGRLNIENVFIISPCGTGVYVTRTYDIPTIRNIEIWNNQNRKPITAFKFGRNDGLRGSHLFAFNVDVGFELEDAAEGGTWAVLPAAGLMPLE
jgi:hypothetical protein